MIKKLMAIITAAACAGIMVTVVPGFAPEVAANTMPPLELRASTIAPVRNVVDATAPSAADIRKAFERKAIEQNIRGGSRGGSGACEQGWPYYDQSCLRDGRRVDGNAGVARVIAMDRSAAIRR
jgi:hypothetical protein